MLSGYCSKIFQKDKVEGLLYKKGWENDNPLKLDDGYMQNSFCNFLGVL